MENKKIPLTYSTGDVNVDIHFLDKSSESGVDDVQSILLSEFNKHSADKTQADNRPENNVKITQNEKRSCSRSHLMGKIPIDN